MATFSPTSAFNNVDFPALGRPRMLTKPDFMRSGLSALPPRWIPETGDARAGDRCGARWPARPQSEGHSPRPPLRAPGYDPALRSPSQPPRLIRVPVAAGNRGVL